MFALNGVLIDIYVNQLINDVQYSPLWLSDAERRSDLGIVPVVDTEPPIISSDQVAVRDSAVEVEGTWEVVWVVRQMSEQEVADVPVLLAEKRAAIWEDIKRLRDHKLQQGGYKVGDHWYHSDVFSRTQQIGLMLMGAGMPSGIQWKTLDNGFVTMTPTLAGQIFMSAASSDNALFIAANAHKAAMDALDDPTAYDYNSGWPSVYVP